MKVLPIIDENDLLLRLRDGDQRAFDRLYNHYRKHIIAHLLYIVKSDEITQDIAQDTFITVWEKRREIDPSKTFRSFLFTIATNKAYDLLRKANYDKKLYLSLLSFLEDSSNQVEEYMFRKEQFEQLQHILQQMPEQQRKVYQLAKIDGYSYDEIAEKIGISRHTVNTHLKRANIFLKQQILNRPELFVFLMTLTFSG